jgi:Tol biopolymer transport system component
VRILSALACVAALLIAVAHPLARAEAPRRQLALGAIEQIEWSPDGRWLAYRYAGRSEVHVIRRDGKAHRKIASGYRGFSWSPDSHHIAVPDVTRGEMRTRLFLADGRLVRRFNGLFRDWSPKGGRILLERLVVRGPGSQRPAIYVADIRTGRERRLVDGVTPDWSPDGRRVAFSTPAEVGRWVCGSDPTSNARIFVIGIDGRGLRRVSHDSGSTERRCHFSPTWAPESKRIAYSEIVATYIPEKDPYAFLIRPGARATTRLGRGAPTWSPNGRFLALRPVFRPGLAIVRASGERRRYFPCAENFSWAPKGSAVAYADHLDDVLDEDCRNQQGQGAIYVARADGSARPRRLAAGSHPAWSRLGSIALARLTDCGDRVFLIAPNGRGLRALAPCPSPSNYRPISERN